MDQKIMEAITLLELNQMVRNEIRKEFSDTYWIRAEVSECKEHYSGHCYLELIQKREGSDAICAKARATIWATIWGSMKPFFEEQTGTFLQAGQKVLVEVSVEFHELYGYNLIIRNIDPAYTMGELSLRRQEIIRRLTIDGVIDLNKELPWPLLPQRLAIVSSPTAAGYEDFMDQLHNNAYSFVFYTAFFPAIMQGESAEISIINALNRIVETGIGFDLVVIIRGGGASADLSCFDRYDLCYYCAQYPLPILSGIGHDRDSSVLDRVSHTSVKTPTAAAEHLLNTLSQEAFRLDTDAEKLKMTAQNILETDMQQLKINSDRLRLNTRERIHTAELLIERREASLLNTSKRVVLQKSQWIEMQYSNLQYRASSGIGQLKHQTEVMEKTLTGFSPDILIQRGFSLTLHNGKIVKSIHDLSAGSEICTHLRDGKIYSTIDKTEIQNG
ncbi:MAG: exodeoxyribonuclease VII large subunit [Bacteroidales bacterium]|nr:exodeoxyribonuclease VII large subunit [Bacteroidales bacterium]